ncbi:hypothetical protein [Actinacidiphila bryophytorum]|nr:hypothetical protein [Actinacidiphila bryophytorum]MBM9435017.1 hypothetical protein [Actinacidiphila bryophytorum]MBN6542108.1 hypothetical protein [Actinacidiphila bryophytorum]
MTLLGMAACGQHQAVGRAHTVPDSADTGLVTSLRKSGFQVNPGYTELYTQKECRDYTYPVLKNCLANNPAAPYVSPIVKTWPDEYVDPAAVNAFGKTKPGYTGSFRLDPQDAIVLYGKMPPPGRYMSLQTWEFSQNGRWTPGDYDKWQNTPNRPVPMQYLFDTIPPDGSQSGRTQSVSALGDTVNNVVMERQAGYSFGKNRYFIVTPSSTTDHAVRKALQAQGVPAKDIFTEQIPSRDSYGPIGPLGMGSDAIDFVSAFRYAVPDAGQEAAADEWRAQPPLKVLRLRAPASLGPVQRYGALTFAPRTANDEGYLSDDLQNLLQAVCGRAVATAHLRSTDCARPSSALSMVDPVRDLGWSGPYCRSINMNCLGDEQDAIYWLGRPLPLDSGQVYAVVDTLATETGNATYAALSVNDSSLLAGVANILNPGLKGSADGYGNAVRNSGKFFVHYFTRDCAVLRGLPDWPRNCTSITTQMLPSHADTSAEGDPALHGTFMPSLRDYIKPGTERGPKSSEVLPPRILTFTQTGK